MIEIITFPTFNNLKHIGLGEIHVSFQSPQTVSDRKFISHNALHRSTNALNNGCASAFLKLIALKRLKSYIINTCST